MSPESCVKLSKSPAGKRKIGVNYDPGADLETCQITGLEQEQHKPSEQKYPLFQARTKNKQTPLHFLYFTPESRHDPLRMQSEIMIAHKSSLTSSDYFIWNEEQNVA